MKKQYFFSCRLLFSTIGTVMLLSGCALFQTPAERIPERTAFSAIDLKQGSMAELKTSYNEHYNLVMSELRQLEEFYQTSSEKPAWLVQKIKSHKKYLTDMETYPFLCPSHDTLSKASGEKTCPSCNGSGKKFLQWGTCAMCSGKGKVFFQSMQGKRCPYCRQLYRGSILGAELHENK